MGDVLLASGNWGIGKNAETLDKHNVDYVVDLL